MTIARSLCAALLRRDSARPVRKVVTLAALCAAFAAAPAFAKAPPTSVVPVGKPAVPAAQPPKPASCLSSILEAEADLGIPRGILLSIALVESGQSGYPAPFALNVAGRAVFARSEVDAARYLRDPQGRLRSGVMAGCMQLSLSHHRDGFRPVEKIVDPQANVRYAAVYLVRLRGETGSWAAAVARYNGGSGDRGRQYQCKVHGYLQALKAESATLIDGTRCRSTELPRIADKTRQAFEAAKSLS